MHGASVRFRDEAIIFRELKAARAAGNVSEEVALTIELGGLPSTAEERRRKERLRNERRKRQHTLSSTTSGAAVAASGRAPAGGSLVFRDENLIVRELMAARAAGNVSEEVALTIELGSLPSTAEERRRKESLRNERNAKKRKQQ